MTRLADVIHSRNNNFHLLRLIAASAVLFSHAFPIATGDATSEPMRERLGCTPGSIAVDLFFLISGMLVTMSLVRRNSVIDFVRARFFRIWPALIVAVLLTVFVLGPSLTILDLESYFSSRTTWRYAFFNSVLLKGVVYPLPGVFSNNPSPNAVNGSLWTLPLEIQCYLGLLLAWIVVRKLTSEKAFTMFVAVTCCAFFAWHCVALKTFSLENSPARLDLMFAFGVGMYLLRDRIILSSGWLAAIAVAVALSSFDLRVFAMAYSLALPYAMVCMAYLPTGRILRFNVLGDYSYGVYIYAFPIEQLTIHLFPTISVAGLFATSMPLTLALAVVSWHAIEKPALRLARSGVRKPAPMAPEATP